MAYTYIQVISIGFPAVACHAPGDGSVYEDIVWDGGAAMPSKETLDTWIASNPEPPQGIVLTKYEFRKLFTFEERIAIDTAPTNTNIPANYRAAVATMMKDLEVSGSVFLTTNQDVADGVNLLEQLGLIGVGRAAQVLANQAPV